MLNMLFKNTLSTSGGVRFEPINSKLILLLITYLSNLLASNRIKERINLRLGFPGGSV